MGQLLSHTGSYTDLKEATNRNIHMGYVDNNLMPDEHLYARGRLHWIIFMKAAAWAVAAWAALLYSLSEQAEAGGHALPAAYGGLLLLFPALWHAATALIECSSTELAVTSKRVIPMCQHRGRIHQGGEQWVTRMP